MEALWSKTLSQIQVERMPVIPGSNTARGYDFEKLHTEVFKKFLFSFRRNLLFEALSLTLP